MANPFGKQASDSLEKAYQSPEIVRQRRETLDALGLTEGQRVLDAGCGPGLLTLDLADNVGPHGEVVGLDSSPDMVELARARCRHSNCVDIVQGDVRTLDYSDGSFSAVTCTQVLLYVPDVDRTLLEIHRVLEPGGCAAIVETDWRGLVLGSTYSDTTEAMIAAWHKDIPSPYLPTRLSPMLATAGFDTMKVKAIPVLSTRWEPGGFCTEILRWFMNSAIEHSWVPDSEARQWFSEQEEKAERGEFFFCVNRYLFVARKKPS